jgi:3-phosphoshikimate 1-carboxyvinyltransferase
MAGRLPQRPLSPLWEELERMGVRITRPTETTIRCQGRLNSGTFYINGSVSSQFITGLLFALALLPGDNQLIVTGNIESKPYIQMTENVLHLFGISTQDYCFQNHRVFQSPGTVTVEGDWSNGAFFLGAKALGNNVQITGLDADSSQGDKQAAPLMEALSNYITVDGRDIPDLIPILAVVAGAKKGASFQNIGRLRLKESDRIESVAAMLNALGADVESGQDYLTISPTNYRGCIIDAKNDHRIAMSAAIASTVASGPVTILGAECVAKSYPGFWSEFTKLGGYYEQYNR